MTKREGIRALSVHRESEKVKLILISRPRFNRVLLAAAFLLSIGGATANASILERVLALLDSAYPDLKALNLSANIAENVNSFTTQTRSLQVGDNVVIGYDMAGTAVLGTANTFGVWVSPVQASGLGSGVNAGLYPVGSAIYALPPAGQLSIFEQSSDGALLEIAQEMVAIRIDGTITNVMASLLPTLATDVTAFDAKIAASYVDLSTMGSTALGAVNAGEIITHVQVVTQPDTLRKNSFDLAQLGRSPNIAFDSALTDNVFALSSRISQMGGGLSESILALNIASNTTEVTGRVSNTVIGLNGRIDAIVSTAIGAVNGGEITN